MVDLATNGADLKRAYEEVCNSKSETNWWVMEP
jgi:hypothetical protein